MFKHSTSSQYPSYLIFHWSPSEAEWEIEMREGRGELNAIVNANQSKPETCRMSPVGLHMLSDGWCTYLVALRSKAEADFFTPWLDECFQDGSRTVCPIGVSSGYLLDARGKRRSSALQPESL